MPKQNEQLDFGFPPEAMDLASVSGVLDELFLLARNYRKSEEFLRLLQFVVSFRRYSAFNAMLVYTQMPGAEYVLPPKAWMKKYGRLPVTNAQPLVMLKPFSPVMFAYDVSQTEGRPLPKGFANPFLPAGQLKKGEFAMSVTNASRDGIEVVFKSLGSTMGGYVRNAADPAHKVGIGLVKAPQREINIDGKRISVIAEITLNSNLSEETNYATLTHELGHLYCGHVGTPDPRWWPDRRSLDRNTGEFEVESVSYLVCRRAGLETPAVAYLHGYLASNEEVPSISLEAVFKAAHRIESMRNKKIEQRKSTVNGHGRG